MLYSRLGAAILPSRGAKPPGHNEQSAHTAVLYSRLKAAILPSSAKPPGRMNSSSEAAVYSGLRAAVLPSGAKPPGHNEERLKPPTLFAPIVRSRVFSSKMLQNSAAGAA